MADAQQIAEVTALVEAAAAAKKQTTDAVTAAVTAQVRTFQGWYDAAAIRKLAEALARLVGAGQRQVATGTDAYAARALSVQLGHRVGPVGRVDVTQARGAPLDAVYGRLADQYRYLAATRGPDAPSPVEGSALPPLDPPQILDRVARRAEVQTATNLQLAMREQWHSVIDATSSKVTGYRRILHPELAKKDGTCALCIVASDHLYYKKDLMPMHDHCNCSILPVVGEAHGVGDPGSAINEEDLSKLYAAAGDSTSGAALRKVKVDVVHHGELGPLLVIRGGTHRGPGDVAKSAAA